MYRWFYEHRFFYDKNVLIPRPATEHLVEAALGYLKGHQSDLVLDIGTGSGAIMVSTVFAKKYRPSKNTKFIATDISPLALKVAKKNFAAVAKKTRKNRAVKFVQGNLLTPVSKNIQGAENMLILSNLPYLSKEALSEPSIKGEPKLALYGGKDDFDTIARLLKQIKKLRICNSKLFLEIGYNQGNKIKKLTQKLWPASKIQVHKDYSNFDRVAEIDLF